MRRLTDALLAALVPLVILLYLSLAPYTKVEESFSIQATHDILTHGIPFEKAQDNLRVFYDHAEFPGSVPRTFVAPLALAGASWPFVWLVGGLDRQTLVRAILGLFNAFCILSFRNGVAKAFGRNAANWFVVFQAGQFHIMYYASRTLPNFFAFGLTMLALRDLLPYAAVAAPVSNKTRYKRALTILTIVGVIFRSEIAILLGTHIFYILIKRRGNLDLIQDIVPSGILGLTIGLALTVSIDSYFWMQFPTWPELSGFIYNIIHGQSSNWGTQPFHFYFTSALPRLIFNPFAFNICIPFALAVPMIRTPSLDIMYPNLAFVIIYSFQPHKEWRFIIYVIPPLLAVAGAGASWIWTRRAKSFAYRMLSYALIASTFASFAASFAMLAVSRLNYPGAEALNRLHTLAQHDKGIINVHMDTLTCVSGVTRFMEIPPPPLSELENDNSTMWVYDKTETEDKLLDPLFWAEFDYALAEKPEKVIGRWEVLDVVNGFVGIGLLRPGEDGEGAGGWDDDLFVGNGWAGDLRMSVERLWRMFEGLMRRYATMGWWVRAKMEPTIRILKRQREQRRMN